MKKFAFKTLSILLAAVLLAAALPLAAFAESNLTCRQDPVNGEHNYEISFDEHRKPAGHSYHLILVYANCECVWCGHVEVYLFDTIPEDHDFGDEIDPEVDMCGTCILCGDYIEW